MAVPQINRAEHLLNMFIKPPVPSSFFMTVPASVNPKNQIQDTVIHVIVKITCSVPTYFNALVPITPTISKRACGFNKETDKAKMIC